MQLKPIQFNSIKRLRERERERERQTERERPLSESSRKEMNGKINYHEYSRKLVGRLRKYYFGV